MNPEHLPGDPHQMPAAPHLEHFTIRCSGWTVAQDEPGKEGQAGDPLGRRCSLTQPGEAAGRTNATDKRELL